MKRLNNIKIVLLFILFIFSINSFSQFSKTHYIPPVPNLNNGATAARIQYLYISTPNEEEFNVTITPIGGEAEPFTVSNSEPIEFFIGNGTETNLIALSLKISVNYLLYLCYSYLFLFLFLTLHHKNDLVQLYFHFP